MASVKTLNPISMKLIFGNTGTKNSSIPIIVILLLLSSTTHLWNLTGFPPIYMDEDIYMRKALKALQGSPLETDRTNSVYGWLILSFALGAIGFPNSLHLSPGGGTHSIEMLYLVPRAFIGILGILDTFLIYKISHIYYKNRNIALVGSILFAVMPMTWLTRYILLEPIQLPFLLLSILFAVYTTKSKNSAFSKIDRKLSPFILSGIFLGLAIFVKYPTFAMIPLVAYLIYRNKSVKMLGLWFLPVILIPLISPMYANFFGMLNIWWDSTVYNVNRGNQPLFDLTGQSPSNAINVLLTIDPLLMILGVIGLIAAAIKRDMFPILWTVPYIILYYILGYVAYYHFIPIYPAFCIAIAKLLLDILDKVKGRNKKIQQILPITIVSAIAIFGFTISIMLITINTNQTHFEAAAILDRSLPDMNTKDDKGSLTMVGGASRFFWILNNVFHKDFNWTSYWTYKSPDNETGKFVMLVERGPFLYWKRTEVDKEQLKQVVDIYNNSSIVLDLKRDLDSYLHSGYPYSSMNIGSLGIGKVEIRANSEAAILFQDPKKGNLSRSSVNTLTSNNQK